MKKIAFALVFGISGLTGHAQIVMSANNADWNSSFPSTPTPANNYITSASFGATGTTLGVNFASTIRANDVGSINTFGGNSLEVVNDTRLLLKQNNGDSASANLILDGGSVTVLAVSGATTPDTLAGAIQVGSGTATLGASNTSAETLDVSSTLTGTGTLALAMDTNLNQTINLTGSLNGFAGTLDYASGGFFGITSLNDLNANLTFASTANGASFQSTSSLTVGTLTVNGYSFASGTTYSAATLDSLSGTTIFSNDLNAITVGEAAAPEPQSYALMLAALGVLSIMARRRRI